jgi:hypothetical protein
MTFSGFALAAFAAAQAVAPATAPQAIVQPQTRPAAVAPTAPQPQSGVALWRNIENGMTVAQLHSLFPQGQNVSYKEDRMVLSDVPIIEGCQAKVNVMHPTGVVKEIVMRGEGSIAGRCSLKIITALSGKYGEPMDKDKVHGSWFAREGKNYIWSRDGITLQLKRYTNGVLGGGGLFAASWELRYSANATNIDL